VNPSTALATVLVDELVRGGVREAVLAPGSRSAPLALALHAADAAGRLRLHVRIDERSAAFLALGLAKASGVPVPVVTTSGTAVLNLHPAVVEASEAGVPLLLLTPTGRPSCAARRQPDRRPGQGVRRERALVRRGGRAHRAGRRGGLLAVDDLPGAGRGAARPGPRAPERRAARAARARRLIRLGGAARRPARRAPLDGSGPGGPAGAPGGRPAGPHGRRPGDGGDALAAQELARARGWPVVAEPSSGARPGPEVVPVPEVVLGGDVPTPERVLVVGRPTLSRAVGRLVASCPADVVTAHGRWPDPSRSAGRALPAVPQPGGLPVDPGWLAAWQQRGAAAREAVEQVLDAAGPLAEPRVAHAVLEAAARDGATLVVGSSTPVRDLLLWGPRDGVRVLANRGAAGIDGTVSTAIGVALAAGPTFALLGDLTFLHDANGLVLGPDEPRPDLTIVVTNNDGGGIFRPARAGTRHRLRARLRHTRTASTSRRRARATGDAVRARRVTS
jgi:2-succinyl-5-enolpyruvyl-6-hydroxy-3-cyclohexene-1-carboxylate synthase